MYKSISYLVHVYIRGHSWLYQPGHQYLSQQQPWGILLLTNWNGPIDESGQNAQKYVQG